MKRNAPFSSIHIWTTPLTLICWWVWRTTYYVQHVVQQKHSRLYRNNDEPK